MDFYVRNKTSQPQRLVLSVELQCSENFLYLPSLQNESQKTIDL